MLYPFRLHLNFMKAYLFSLTILLLKEQTCGESQCSEISDSLFSVDLISYFLNMCLLALHMLHTALFHWSCFAFLDCVRVWDGLFCLFIYLFISAVYLIDIQIDNILNSCSLMVIQPCSVACTAFLLQRVRHPSLPMIFTIALVIGQP